ncbi:cytochrome b [Marinicella meishanensis]|uniref:cytochrome b n=1 Tax=Marinicella meishanensis TaxID=2873263 RepID=UPI001CBF9CF8|nr:cytochrome b/b6 domain-containing protein [Marinicella sp. NBU2979]
MAIKDNRERYGLVSRTLHWGMALLILWQFLSAGAHYFLEDTAIEAFFWPSHKPLGVLLLLLMVLRLLWALFNAKRRPPSINLAAKLGHAILYLLVIAVPTIALIRQYGSGRAFEPFGIPLFAGFEGDKIDWMLKLGGDWHGELGWVLLVLLLGHVAMALKHRKSQAEVFKRMGG